MWENVAGLEALDQRIAQYNQRTNQQITRDMALGDNMWLFKILYPGGAELTFLSLAPYRTSSVYVQLRAAGEHTLTILLHRALDRYGTINRHGRSW